jgi:hypothetical protein
MNTWKSFLKIYSITALAITTAVMIPYAAHAVSIGEIALHSKLGEPLRAQVDLTLGNNEHLDDTCLSLVVPDSAEEDANNYLTKANLFIRSEGKHRYIEVSSNKAFNEVFARLRLQIKCSGMGSVIKSLIILPDLEATDTQAQITAPQTPVAKIESSEAAPSPDLRVGEPTSRPPRDTQTDIKNSPAEHLNRPAKRRHQISQAVASKTPDRASSFRLKLSGEPIDSSRIGKITQEERALLLARQKFLDADDQMASFLAMQHQVKQLQDEIVAIKLQLAKLGTSTSPNVVSPATVSNSSLALTQSTAPLGSLGATDQRTSPPNTANQATVQPGKFNLQNRLVLAIGITLGVLLLLLGIRYYTQLKSRVKVQLPDEPPPLPIRSEKIQPAPIAVTSAPPPASKPLAPPLSMQPRMSTVATVAEALPKEIEKKETEEDSMLEEAGLYAAHGRPAKAVEILQEIIKVRPSKAEAWPLLLSIYSSLGKSAEFERTARGFLKHHKDSPSWSGIQALGRTFDQSNPLYIDNNSRISATPLLPDTATSRRPVGDVLIEMGVLSKQDLQNCLDDFDPKKHGRFGGYLVARKAITLAQLDKALLQQQGVHTEAKPGVLPSLQEMENFLADFDPKRDGSVGEFLAARNAATPEQLSQLLQGSSKPEIAAPIKKPEEVGGTTLNFVLEPSVIDFAPTSDKNKPLEFEDESSSAPFPNIDFEMGSHNASDKKQGAK